MSFQFKSFSLKQEQSAMKIGTDSVLLGCFCDANTEGDILDIGTGTGLLALMMAQKSKAKIEAIEIDVVAYKEAKENFENAIWNNRLTIKLGDIKVEKFDHSFDLIITNPPYYKSGKSYSIEDEQRSQARHDKDLPFSDLCKVVVELLNDEGSFWLILPNDESMVFMEEAKHAGLYLQKLIEIKPKESKKVNRVVMKWGKGEMPINKKSFTIYNEDGTATADYIKLTIEFYLWKQIASTTIN